MQNFEQGELISKENDFQFYKVTKKDKNILCSAKISSKTIDNYYKNEIISLSRETSIIPRLNHPAISKFIFCSPVNFDNSPQPTIISEFYSNGALNEIIEQSASSMSDTEKLIIIYGIAAGMSYLHSNQILHCDLKPSNILLDDYLFPKITGFSVSRQISSNHQLEKYVIKGTPAYIAPEVYNEEGNSKESDVYSFSLIVYQLMMNEKPFKDFNDIKQIKEEILENGFTPKFDQNVPDAYKTLIKNCCSDMPENRPKFKEIVNELKNNHEFITSDVNEEEFRNYVKMIEESEISFKPKTDIKCIDIEKVKCIKEYEKNPIFKGIYETEKNNLSFFLNSQPNQIEETKDMLKKFDISKNNFDLSKITKQNNIRNGSNAMIVNIVANDTKETYIGKLFEKMQRMKEGPFTHEVKAYTALNDHPCIVKYIGHSTRGLKRKPIIILEKCSNGSLKDALNLEKKNLPVLGWDETKKLILIYGIAAGMSHMHSKGIIHRNLETNNILLDDSLLPKICDFQCAKLIGEIDSVDTQPIMPVNAAPESINGMEYTEKYDVFSFALILYEIVTNESPYYGISQFQSFTSIAEGKRPEFKTQMPDCYREMIEKCWSQEPEKRPTFDEIMYELRTNPEFITESIDVIMYRNYINYVNDPEDNEYDFKPCMINRRKKVLSVNLVPIDLEKFKRGQKIGSGSFGKVYKVAEKETKAVYACKISKAEINEECDDKYIQNLERELNIISQLSSPSVLKFVGYNPLNFKDQPRPTIITELVTNGSLDCLLNEERNGLSVEQWNDTKKLINIYGIAKGMAYIHSKDIIHRDLKPANIFLDDHLFPKIGDFGLSKSLKEEKDTKDDFDLKSGLKGTYVYISPEIFRAGIYTKPCDVYAFALIVYEIITNEIPYENFVSFTLMHNVDQGYRPPFKFPIPHCYQELIEKCWIDDPQQRPTFDEIVETLKTNQEFITDTIDLDEFLNYVDFVEDATNCLLKEGGKPKVKKVNDKIVNLDSLKKEWTRKCEDEIAADNSLSENFLDLSRFSRKRELVSKSEISNIFKITDQKTGNICTAKVSNFEISKLRRDEIINLSRELSILSQIKHPSFLQFIGYSPTDFTKKRRRPVIVTEYASKETLSTIMEMERESIEIPGWNETTKLITIYGISSGMSYLHSHNILHRDLTPESIFLDKNLYPKIGNLSLSIINHTLESMTSQSMSGVKGNPAYSAPEVLQMNDYSKPGDVYSFAFIVFEMMTNEIPFKDKQNLTDMFNSVVVKGDRPKIKEKVPRCYRELIERCWSQNPNERPTFDEIEFILKSEKEFITDKINEQKFRDYVKSIEDSQIDFYSNKKIVDFKDLIKSKSRIDESGESNEPREKVEDGDDDDDDKNEEVRNKQIASVKTDENRIVEDENENEKEENNSCRIIENE